MHTLTTPETPSDIAVLHGIPSAMQRQAAEIYYEAFQRKLNPILGTSPQAINLLQASLHPANAFTAVQGDQLLGILGFHHAGHWLVEVGFENITKTFGFLGATWRGLLGSLLSRQPRPDELLMDGIAVQEHARGRGIGKHLFNALFTFALEHNYRVIRLDVVDSNPRARQLYERLGFVVVKTQPLPWMKPLGFTAVATMLYSLRPAG